MTFLLAERRWSAHLAVLDPMHGTGLLARPRPTQNVADPFADGSAEGSVHEAELHGTVLPELDRLGFEPGVVDGGDVHAEQDWQLDVETSDGRVVVALFGVDPVVSSPSLEQIEGSFRALRAELALIGRVP